MFLFRMFIYFLLPISPSAPLYTHRSKEKTTTKKTQTKQHDKKIKNITSVAGGAFGREMPAM
jgi:hypothetical protein